MIALTAAVLPTLGAGGHQKARAELDAGTPHAAARLLALLTGENSHGAGRDPDRIGSA